MTMSVPDSAAEVSAKYREAKDAICALRQLDRGGDWTSYQLMLDEAMDIAHDGLRNAWKMMDRVRQLAKESANVSGGTATPNVEVSGRAAFCEAPLD